jgi:ATP-dependent Clp protease ATP-binding subunit ClpA
MHRVVDKFIMQLEAQLADRNVTIELTQAARQLLAELGYDVAMGARPLGRVIQDKIKKPLSEELLFGQLQEGGVVLVDVKDAAFIFTYPKPSPKTIGKTDIKKLPKSHENA